MGKEKRETSRQLRRLLAVGLSTLVAVYLAALAVLDVAGRWLILDPFRSDLQAHDPAIELALAARPSLGQ